MRKALFAFLLLFSVRPLLAQTAPEGIWQGYDGEWRHVSSQLLALAEAMPEEKFAWRPAPGVRSASEVFMHIALANFYLLSVTGPKMPADMNEGMDKSVTLESRGHQLAETFPRRGEVRPLGGHPKKTSNARSTLPIATPPWTACICASSFMPMSTWDSSSPTPA